MSTWTRAKTKVGKRSSKQRRDDPRTESHRWPNLVHEAQQKFNFSTSVDELIHVAERKADDYTSYCSFAQKGIGFVFRVQHSRSIEDEEEEKLFDSIQEAQIICQTEVPLCARKKTKKDGHRTRVNTNAIYFS